MKTIICRILPLLAIALVLGVVSEARRRKTIAPLRSRTIRMPTPLARRMLPCG